MLSSQHQNTLNDIKGLTDEQRQRVIGIVVTLTSLHESDKSMSRDYSNQLGDDYLNQLKKKINEVKSDITDKDVEDTLFLIIDDYLSSTDGINYFNQQAEKKNVRTIETRRKRAPTSETDEIEQVGAPSGPKYKSELDRVSSLLQNQPANQLPRDAPQKEPIDCILTDPNEFKCQDGKRRLVRYIIEIPVHGGKTCEEVYEGYTPVEKTMLNNWIHIWYNEYEKLEPC